MSELIGAVFVDLSKFDDEESTQLLIQKALKKVPDGRNLVIIWLQPKEWAEQRPIEAWIINSTLGPPEHRESSVVKFFGNGAVRIYGKNKMTPREIWHWVCVRKDGEKIYRRTDSTSKATIKKSTLSTLDPIFTRDAANNVWHLSGPYAVPMIISRFQVLLTWADEFSLIVSSKSVRKMAYPLVSFKEGTIGIAQKIAYDGVPIDHRSEPRI